MHLILLFAVMFMSVVQSAKAETVSEFLHQSKESYIRNINSAPDNVKKVHFVMGNESADLDSIISSIAYAYLLQKEHPSDVYVPLLNIVKSDIPLRKDALYLFESNHILLDDVLFLNDVEFDKLYAHDLFRLNLVDHNTLKPSQKAYSSTIETIVDHHVDENGYYPLLRLKEIAVVGSASTLIAERFKNSSHVALPPDLALMLLAPILIDTADLESREKTTLRDRNAVIYLESLTSVPDDYYRILYYKKMDVTNLTPLLLFSKDFKEYLDGDILYGISSIPSSVYWNRKQIPSILADLETYAKERDLVYLILLMHNPDEGPKRTVLVYSSNSKYIRAFQNHVTTDKVLNKSLELLKQPKDERVALYGTNTHTSRKQFQPLLQLSKSKDITEIIQSEKAVVIPQ